MSKQANEPPYLDEFYKDNKKVSRQLMEAGGRDASSDGDSRETSVSKFQVS